MTDRTLLLGDGRTLGFCELGAPTGPMLVYFHGHPGSRRAASFLHEAASRAGVRLVGVDRTGMGSSTYQPRRTVLGWPDDVAALTDALGVERFTVVGFSGGGAYALACAWRFPERVLACGVMSGVGRTGAVLSFLSRWLPWILLPLARRRFLEPQSAERALVRAEARWPESDRKAFERPGARATFAASIAEALQPGARGAVLDGRLIATDWGFLLEEIQTAVDWWHGEQDGQIEVIGARALAARIPGCRFHALPADGHLSPLVTCADPIVATLIGSAG